MQGGIGMKLDMVMEMLSGLREIFNEMSDLEKQRVKECRVKRHNQAKGEGK